MKGKLLLLLIIPGVLMGTSLGLHSAGNLKVLHNPLEKTVNVFPRGPKTIVIPKIRVHASIESVSIDSKGRMDVPKNWENAAWYNRGPKPGENGNAVIDGHVDNPSGKPAVFWNVKKLQPGDIITIIDAGKQSYSYRVNSIINYSLSNIPLQNIFNSRGSPHLNLITCAGRWDHLKHEYTERTVVFSNLVSQR